MTTHHRDAGGGVWRADADASQRTSGWTPRWALRLALRLADARIDRIERELMGEFATADTQAQLDELEALLGSRDALLRRLTPAHH